MVQIITTELRYKHPFLVQVTGNSKYTGTLQYLAKHPFPLLFQNGLHAISLFGYHERCLTIVTALLACLNEELTSYTYTYSFLL